MKRLFGIFLLFSLFLLLTTYHYLQEMPPPPESIHTVATLVDGNGDSMLSLVLPSRREWTALGDISPHVVEGFLAAEDHFFYKHRGFNIVSIARSLLYNLKSGSPHRGASTITQQYARNLFNSFEKTWSRKFREAVFTIRMEANYSKDDILEGYLNTINFGHGNYGITAASRFYFNKSPADLTLGESALLVGIPAAPIWNSPILHLEHAKSRQKMILSHMDLSEKQRQNAYDEPLLPTQNPRSGLSYYSDAVFDELESLMDVYKFGKLTVHTPYQPEIQATVDYSLNTLLPSPDLQAAVIVMAPDSGKILALAGGSDYQKSTFNRAIYARRQVGSLLKPILYYGALEYGFTPSTTFYSRPTTFRYWNGQEDYSPRNFRDKYAEAPLSMANALATSDNIYAAKLHNFLGLDVLPQLASRLGITTIPLLPSAILGITDLSLLEITRAYGIFANGGHSQSCKFITRVQSGEKNIWLPKKEKHLQVLDPVKTFILNEMMTGMFDPKNNHHLNATGTSITPLLTRRYAAKSGTTPTDAWIVGFTPQLLATVWVGYDENRYLDQSASHLIWAHIMEGSHLVGGDNWYDIPPGVVPVWVDAFTGAPLPEDAPNAIMRYFENR